MISFKKWLISESSNSGKTGLYPLGYGGIGLYPPQSYLTRSADAIFYLSIDDRIYNSKDIFDISHLPDDSSHPVQPKKSFALKSGDGGEYNIKKLKTYKK
jgi:hypothetical protein